MEINCVVFVFNIYSLQMPFFSFSFEETPIGFVLLCFFFHLTSFKQLKSRLAYSWIQRSVIFTWPPFIWQSDLFLLEAFDSLCLQDFSFSAALVEIGCCFSASSLRGWFLVITLMSEHWSTSSGNCWSSYSPSVALSSLTVLNTTYRNLPGSPVVKHPPCNAGGHRFDP